MKQALGLVEIQGLPTAVYAADAMVKAANVRLIGLENAKGLGYMTIKVLGDVGAVTAAVSVGRQTGIEYGKLVSSKVIPRPSDSVDAAFCCERKAEDGPPPEPPAPPAGGGEAAGANGETGNEDTEEISEDTRDVNENTEEINKDTEEISKDTEDVSKDTEIVSENAEDVSKDTEDADKDTEVVSESSEKANKDTSDESSGTPDPKKNDFEEPAEGPAGLDAEDGEAEEGPAASAEKTAPRPKKQSGKRKSPGGPGPKK